MYDPSQTDRPGKGARLPSGVGAVVVILEEAMGVARTDLDYRTPVVMLAPNRGKKTKGEISLSKNTNHRS
jgi:hypothetical protein